MVKIILALALLLGAIAAGSGDAKPMSGDPPPCQPGHLC